MRYRAFRTKKDNKFYFQFQTDAGDIVLKSQAYADKDACFNGIRSVIENASNPDRYKKLSDEGNNQFIIRAGNNQEIARSVPYGSDSEVDNMIDLCRTQIPNAKSTKDTGGNKDAATANSSTPPAAPTAKAEKASGSVYKEYKPLAFYKERIEGTEFGYDSFSEGDKHYFTVNHEGSPVLISEDYTSTAGRDNGIESVKKNLKVEDRYVPMVHTNGKHYFSLVAGNKQEIATSRWFDTKKEMTRAIAWLQGTGGTRKRKKAAKEDKPAAERKYLQQGLSYPCSDITYDTFQSGGNNRFYFVFKSKEDKAVLINGDVRGYETEEDLNEGLKQLSALAPHEKNYDRKTTKNGKHYFYVVNADGKSVGRGSLFYAEKSDMEAAIKLLACGVGTGATAVKASSAAPVVAAAAVVAAAPAAKAAKQDDYLPCESYAGKPAGFNTFSEDGEHYFSYNAGNGDTWLRSEGYKSEGARDNGIASVKKNAPNDSRWVTGDVMNGKHYFYALRAGNNQEIAKSCFFESEAAMMAAMNGVKDSLNPKAKPAVVKASAPASAPLSAVATPVPDAELKAPVDDYLECAAYKNSSAGFNNFTDKASGEHYFSYNASNGDVLLRSEGYKSESARDNGIESVKKNANEDKRWVLRDVMNSKRHYYALRAGNSQEIARSCYYHNAAAAKKDWDRAKFDLTAVERAAAEAAEAARLAAARLAAEKAAAEKSASFKLSADKNAATAAAAAAAAAALAAKSSRAPKATSPVKDDYLPCEAYAGDAGFHTFRNEDTKEYFFAYNDKDGNTLLRSEGYKTPAARENGMSSVRKNGSNKDRWTKETAMDGKYHYYILKAGNGQEIARSCYMEDGAKVGSSLALLGAAFPVIAASTSSSSTVTTTTKSSSFAKIEQAKATPPPPTPKAVDKEDDYLPCKEYAGRNVNDKQNNVALFKHENGLFYFAMYNKDGSVRLRSEGFVDAKTRDEELSGVIKYANTPEMYSKMEKGKYFMEVLKDKTGREVGRSCLQKLAPPTPPVVPKKTIVAAAAVAAAAIVVKAPTPPPPPPKKVVAETPPPPPPPKKKKKPVPPPPPKKKKVVPPPPPKKVPVVPPPVAAAATKKGCASYWWLLLLLIPLLLLLLRGCGGCATAPPPVVIPPVVVPPPPPVIKAAVCPNASDFKLAEGSSGGAVCDYLSDPESTYPKRFTFDNVGFARNTNRLNSKAKKSLDDLVVCMKGCDNVNVDVYGYIKENEKSSYRGSKEVSLDDVRAKSVYDYLKSRGIDESRINYEGAGTGDSNNAIIQINK